MITKENIYEDYVTVADAAQLLNVNNSRIRQLCIAGRFEGAFKIAETWLIPRKEVENHTRLKPGVKPKQDNKVFIAGILEQMKDNNTNEQQ